MATPTQWDLNIAGSDIDAEATDVTLDRLLVDARTGQTLTFTENAKHYENTWDEGDAVIFEYPAGTVVFSGQITRTKRIGKTGQEAVRYTASDWRILSQNIQITRRGPDHVDGEDTYPERIYNAPTTDPDSKYNAIAAGSTVGAILTDLFGDFDTYLQAEGGAGVTGFSSSDLSALSHVPGKMVLSGMTFEQAVVTILAEQGRAYATWVDVNGQWRFWDTRNIATTNTVTIATDDVEDTDLERHIRGRYTAVTVHGKPGVGDDVMFNVVGFGADENGVALSGLTKDWTGALETTWNRMLGAGFSDVGTVTSNATSTFTIAGKTWTTDVFADGFVVFPRYSWATKLTIASNTANTITLASPLPSGAGDVGDPVFIQSQDGVYQDVFRLFQITDATKREIVETASGEVDCCPHVVGFITNASGTVVGTDHVSVRLEDGGRIRTEIPMITSQSNGYSTGDSTLFANWKFQYCYRDDSVASTMTARFPVTPATYSGEANGTPWSIARELHIVVPEFDDQLDVAVYQSVAEEIHKTVSSVGLSGRVTLGGIDWTYLDPRQRVHVAHAADTTNWEALGASLTSTTYDFGQMRTSLSVTDVGDTIGIDYQAMVAQIVARQELAQAQAETAKLGNYINCRDLDFKSGTDVARVVGETAEPPQSTYSTLTPSYATDSIPCKCDEVSSPCHDNDASGQIKCLPDDRQGMTVVHPGISLSLCSVSQLAWQDNAGGACKPYFPFACQGVSIDPDDTNCPDGDTQSALCTSGTRTLISVEPFDINSGATGDEISPAQLLLLSIRAHDNYMQHVEEAMCCLDNRLACTDAHIWGGVQCPSTATGGDKCKLLIVQAIAQVCAQVKGLATCVNSIHYAAGPNHKNCTADCSGDYDGCGPC